MIKLHDVCWGEEDKSELCCIVMKVKGALGRLGLKRKRSSKSKQKKEGQSADPHVSMETDWTGGGVLGWTKDQFFCGSHDFYIVDFKYIIKTKRIFTPPVVRVIYL